MAGRYDPRDLNIYGAADDEEMDMILDALERASKRDDDADALTRHRTARGRRPDGRPARA